MARRGGLRASERRKNDRRGRREARREPAPVLREAARLRGKEVENARGLREEEQRERVAELSRMNRELIAERRKLEAREVGGEVSALPPWRRRPCARRPWRLTGTGRWRSRMRQAALGACRRLPACRPSTPTVGPGLQQRRNTATRRSGMADLIAAPPAPADGRARPLLNWNLESLPRQHVRLDSTAFHLWMFSRNSSVRRSAHHTAARAISMIGTSWRTPPA